MGRNSELKDRRTLLSNFYIHFTMFFIRLTCDITSSVEDEDGEEEDAQTPKWNEGVIKGAAFVIPDVNLECQLPCPLPVGKDTTTICLC